MALFFKVLQVYVLIKRGWFLRVRVLLLSIVVDMVAEVTKVQSEQSAIGIVER